MPNIIVCMKIIIDPEAPVSIFKLDREKKIPLSPVGMPPVFSPFDLNALEAALRLKDRQECKVNVLSIGKSLPKALLQKALAMGADEAVVVEDVGFEHLAPFSTAHVLVNTIRKIGNVDLIFTGRQSADWDAGLVWAGIADLLDIPCVTIARRADIENGRVVVERCASDGIEILEADLPALITFSSEAGEPRFASLQAMMKATKKPIQRWRAEDVGFQPSRTMDMMALEDLFEPELPEINCRYITGEDNEAKGRQLARIMQTQGFIKPLCEV